MSGNKSMNFIFRNKFIMLLKRSFKNKCNWNHFTLVQIRHFENGRFCGLLAALYTIQINTSRGWIVINIIFPESQDTYLSTNDNFVFVYWANNIMETWFEIGALLTANGFRTYQNCSNNSRTYQNCWNNPATCSVTRIVLSRNSGTYQNWSILVRTRIGQFWCIPELRS